MRLTPPPMTAASPTNGMGFRPVGKIAAAIVALLGLSGCVSSEMAQRQAANNCQAVGISETDPQFETCTAAYQRAYLEGRLEQSYIDALSPAPQDRRRRNPGHGF